MTAKFTSIQRSKAKLGVNHPFFASILMTTPLIADVSIPTAATDMRNIYYNPDFIDSLDSETAMFVWAHEVMHIALLHGLRRMGRHPQLWNIACDYAINLMLYDSGFKVWTNALLDHKFAGMTAEQIYSLLVKDAKKELARAAARPGLACDLQEPQTSTAVEKSAIERSVRQRVTGAVTMAKMAGNMPVNLDRIISGVLNPKVPWEDYLREYMTRVTFNDESWSKRNRRFADFYLPSRHNTRMGEIVVIGDTSGSIGEQELNQVAAEVSSIADVMQPERVRMVWADAEVSSEQVFECGEALVFKPSGGGGTDMRVPLQHVEQYTPEVVVLITDGYTPWPDREPPYPLIVCCTTNAAVPVGLVVRL